MSTHSSILAWEIPWAEEPGRLQSIELQRVEQDWTTEQQQMYNAYKDVDGSFNLCLHCEGQKLEKYATESYPRAQTEARV